MDNPITFIPLHRLFFVFVPVLIVIIILNHWSLDWKKPLHATFRMLIQLTLVGYVLRHIFYSEATSLLLIILILMVFVSTYIALGVVKKDRANLFWITILAIAIGGGVNLLIVTKFILVLDPWYQPRYLIPLAGMIFSSAMNGVSLAVERLYAELGRNVTYQDAKGLAMKAALLPITNSLLAVGLVSLPGMMTGQILSGISPLIAVRYQIVVMCMIFSSVGLSSYLFLVLNNKYKSARSFL